MNCIIHWLPLAILPFLAIQTGCSDGRLPTYPVAGQVVFPDGSSVRIGSIEFSSTQHPIQARGKIDKDGRFQLTTYTENDGAVAGKHRCVVTQFVIVEDIPNFKPSTEGIVDRRFGSYETSGLEFDVSASEKNMITVKVEGMEGQQEHKPTRSPPTHKHEHGPDHKHE